MALVRTVENLENILAKLLDNFLDFFMMDSSENWDFVHRDTQGIIAYFLGTILQTKNSKKNKSRILTRKKFYTQRA